MAMANTTTVEDLTFGERLALSRRRVGLTQTQMAELLHVSRQVISKWEKDAGRPDDIVQTAKDWGQHTGYSPAWLLLGSSSGYNPDFHASWSPAVVEHQGQGVLALGLLPPRLSSVPLT